MTRQPPPLPPAATRVALSLFLPVLAALAFAWIATGTPRFGGGDQRMLAQQLAGAGLVTWLVGLRWYHMDGMGLRGRRPLYAGLGFASLGWLGFLAARFLLVEVGSYGADDTFRTFGGLLIFEAFVPQLWAFGVFFRSAAEWRGPLTAAVAGGLLFGAIGFIFFQESFILSPFSLLYFAVWGIFYGIIRLRTGSIVGTAVVQALQSFTAWHVMNLPAGTDPNALADQLRNLYLVSSALYLILIWRLWPRREDDYRV
jgi:hypothetical protein